MRNKFLTLILTLVLCVALLPLSAMGEGVQQASIQQVFADQGRLWITFSTSLGGRLTSDSFSLLMNSHPLHNDSFGLLENSNLPTSYVLLIDNSNELGVEGFTQARHIAAQFLRLMPANSNVAITTVQSAAGRFPLEFSQNKDAMVDQLNGMTILNKNEEKASLYRAVANVDNLLNHASGAYPRRCLIVFSDGMERSVEGLTTAELAESLEQVNMVIHTVALMKNNQDMALVHEMGSWSRKTGGELFSIKTNQAQNSGSIKNAYTKPNEKNPTTQLAMEMADMEKNLYAASFTVPADRQGELNKACGIQMRIEYNGEVLYYPQAAMSLSQDVLAELNQTPGEWTFTARPTASPTLAASQYGLST